MYTATPTKPERKSALADYNYDALDDLLFSWFLWESGYSAAEGFSNQDKSFANVQSSRQWESTSEIMERQVADYLMPLVSTCVDDLGGDDRLAIRIEQRNRLGPSVWRNPRAGDNQSAAYVQAKGALKPILLRRGVEW